MSEEDPRRLATPELLEDAAMLLDIAGVGPEENWHRALDCAEALKERAQKMRYESSDAQQAYADRNLAVQALASLATTHGFRVGIRERETDWPILVIDLPTGQVSWHIPKSELTLTAPDYPDPWDGHDVAEKQRRVARFFLTWRPE